MKFIQRIDKSVCGIFTVLWVVLFFLVFQLLDINLNVLHLIMMFLVAFIASFLSALALRRKVFISKEHLHFGMKKYKWNEINKISYQQFVRVNEGGIVVDQYFIFEMSHRQKVLSMKGLEDVAIELLHSICEVHPGIELSDELKTALNSTGLYLEKIAHDAKMEEQKRINEFYGGNGK